MIYTAVEGVQKHAFLPQIEKWMMAIPGVLALAIIVTLIALRPGSYNGSGGQPTTQTTKGASTAAHQSAASRNHNQQPSHDEQDATAPALNSSYTPRSTAQPLSTSGSLNKASNVVNLPTSKPAPTTSTSLSSSTPIAGVGSGDTSTAPTGSTGTNSPTPSGDGLSLPLTVCVGTKDTTISLLGTTITPVCVN